jgi:putative intracellular protease/amidase
MTPPRRAIISITSAHAPLHHGNETGLFISEALHPFNVFKNAGFEVDLVSTTGTYVPDWLSLQPDFLPEHDRKQWEDVNGEFRKKLDNMTKPEEIDASKVSSDVGKRG